nr:ligand-binding sensor domain-containing diguanylate cyclase [Stenotrophomonas mori]
MDAGKPFRDYVTDAWGAEHGLPQPNVRAIAQDRAGYLWLGSPSGLARFDGVRFVHHGPREIPGFGDGILALYGDAQDRLWIGTSQGLLMRDRERFRRILPVVPDRPSAVGALLWSGGRLLAGCSEGVCTPQDGRLQRLHALPSPAHSLLARGDGLWAGGDGQVFHIDAGGVRPLPLPASAAGAAVTALAQSGGRLWAGTRQGLFQLRDGVWHPAPGAAGQPPLAVEAMLADRDGNLWVATPQHLERLRHGRAGERVEEAGALFAVRSIFEDRDGNLWLGSMARGVTRTWNGPTRRLGRAEGLRSPLLWSIAAAPDGTVWVGGNDGVDAWRDGRFGDHIPGARLPHPEAYSLLADARQLWIGTRAGVALLRDGRVQRPAVLAPLRDAQINGIVRGRDGRLWFATSHGLYLLDVDNRLSRYAEADGLSDPRVRGVLETRGGRLLLGTEQGLYEWRAGRLLPIGRLTGLDAALSVTALLELGDGRWVLGSRQTEGLHVYDGQRWRQLDHRQRLPSNVAFHLAENQDALWVAGMHGVYRLPLAALDQALADPARPAGARMVLNSGADQAGGQRGKCCNGAGSSRGLVRAGQLWLPTRDGALLVDLAAEARSVPRAIRIDSVLAQGQRHLPASGTLRLPLDARDLTFEFSLPDLRPTSVPRLRYRLLGHDPSWRDLEDPAVRSARYAHLGPGRYTFEVADFNHADPPASIARAVLELPRRFHQTAAFRALLVALCGGLLWLGYLGLQQRHARQRTRLERLVQERTRDLRAANARLEAISFTDPLTQLRNRRYLAQQIPIDLSFYERDPAYRDGGDVVVFALLDVDHFKAINDTHGHAAGDRVLEQIGRLLGSVKRKGDYVARWGGEEFLLVFRPLPRGSLARLGQRLCSRIAEHPFDLGDGDPHRLTVSVGLIECPLFPGHPQLLGWEQLVTLADRALYRAKTAGRDTWVAYQPAAGACLPETLQSLDGDPWWLVEDGLLELFGIAGVLPADAGR